MLKLGRLLGATALATLAMATTALAEYPEKPVEFVVPWPPGDLEDVLTRMIADLVDHLPRYQRYVERFNASIEKVDGGGIGFVTKPTVDSLHNIWFEFHQDILSVLGRPRDTT